MVNEGNAVIAGTSAQCEILFTRWTGWVQYGSCCNQCIWKCSFREYQCILKSVLLSKIGETTRWKFKGMEIISDWKEYYARGCLLLIQTQDHNSCFIDYYSIYNCIMFEKYFQLSWKLDKSTESSIWIYIFQVWYKLTWTNIWNSYTIIILVLIVELLSIKCTRI